MLAYFRKRKIKYYNNLDLKILDDNKRFWKSIKPLFSNKHNVSQKNIVIVERDTITSKNEEVADKLNKFFIKAVENLEIELFAPNDINNALHRRGNYKEIRETSQHFKK